MARRLATAVLSLVLATTACLPDESRPPPGELLVVAEGSEATLSDGFTRPLDGATYRFDVALLTLGTFLVDDDEHCARYAPSYYDWLIDFTEPGPHKVGLLHGLGDCRAGFVTYAPDEVTVFGAGADAGLADHMVPANLYVEGRAERDGESIAFRFRVYWPGELSPCLREPYAPQSIVTTLGSGQRRELSLVIRIEEILASFTFDELLESDFDGDGVVNEADVNIISPDRKSVV